MIGGVRRFLAFVYDFVVGDDWRVAIGVAAALGLTYGITRTSFPAWWLMPLAGLVLLGGSVYSATRPRRSK